MRGGVTIAIWIVVGIMSEELTAQGHDLGYITTMILVIGAILITLVLWGQEFFQTINEADVEKAKRGSDSDARLQLLMTLLSDEERAAVRDRLIDTSGDGEIIGLDAVLHDDSVRRH